MAQFPAPYCPEAFSNNVEPISKVTFGSFVNSSSAALAGVAHEDFTSQTITIFPGQTYTVELEGNTGGSFTNILRMFIDYNQNNAFSTVVADGEMFELGTITGSTGTDGVKSTFSYAVPLTASPGSYRIRFMKRFSTAPTPCNTAGWGQAEDYTLVVLPLTACSGTPVAGQATATSSTACNGAPLGLSLANTTFGTGISYRWQRSPNNANWTFIDTARTTPNYTTTQTSSNWYRAQVICGANSSFSASVQVTTPTLLAAGTYTVNGAAAPSPTNFTTFASAIEAMRCGIAGNVVINVAPNSGPYNELISIPEIGGNRQATVTINGNGNTLNPVTTTNSLAAITLNGADRIIIDSFIIDLSANAANTYGIWLTGRADSNIIRRNQIILPANSTTTTLGGIIISGSNTSVSTTGNNANSTMIERNTITGGYYGMYVTGSSALPYNSFNRVVSNVLQESGFYGIYTTGQDSLLISRNEISRLTKTNSQTFYGIYVTGSAEYTVERNNIHDPMPGNTASTSSAYGIYAATANGTPLKMARVINNIIYGFNSAGLQYGIQHGAGSNIHYLHNTVVLDGSTTNTAATYAFYNSATALTNVLIRNNIGYVSRVGTGIKAPLYLGATTSYTTVNNNVWVQLSSTGTTNHVVNLGGITYNTLAAWKATTGNPDNASVDVDPAFINPAGGDLTPAQQSLNGLGANVGVLIDINGKPRSTTPDPGAVEFDLPPCTGIPQTGNIAASVNPVCANTPFTLTRTGGSTGTGLRLQWQSAQVPSGAWNNVDTPQTTSFYQLSQPVTSYYRLQVTCGASTRTSDSILVVTPSLRSGSFTVNPAATPSSTVFSSLQAAVDNLACGINGPVTINVAPNSGPYTEQVVIGSIAGVSAINRIVINGNGNTFTSNLTNTTGNRSLFTLNGADFVTIDSFVMEQVGTSTVGFGITLTNRADSNIIRRNRISQSITSTSTAFSGIVLTGSITSATTSGDNGNGNLIEGNTVVGGYYGISINGNGVLATSTANNTVRRNTLQDQYQYGVYSANNTRTSILANDVSRPTRANSGSGVAGVYISSGTRLLVDKNRVHNLFDALSTSTSTSYGIYGFPTVPADSMRNVYSNNAIYRIGGLGIQYGIYIANYNFQSYLHNTVVLDEATSANVTTTAYYLGGTGNIYRNNVAYVNRPGTGTRQCFYFGTTPPAVSDNNLMHIASTTGTIAPVYLISNFTSLADWKASNNQQFDQQSFDADPLFDAARAANQQFIITNALLDNRGVPVGVNRDIVDSLRRPITPDIGAWEFRANSSGIDLVAEAIVAPANAVGNCYSDNQTAVLRIRNAGQQVHNFATNPATVALEVSGARTATVSTLVNSGLLGGDTSLTVTIPTTFLMDVNGVYTLKGRVTVVGDVSPLNDTTFTARRTKVALNVGPAIANVETVCFAGNVGLRSSGVAGYSSLQWQQSLDSGATFTIINGANDSVYIAMGVNRYTIYRLIGTCQNNQVISSSDTVRALTPSLGSASGDSVCVSGPMVLKSTLGTGAVNNVWYAANSGGSSLATTLNYTTPVLTNTTNYFVAASAGSSTQGFSGLGQVWNSTVAAGQFQTTTTANAAMIFTTSVPLTIQNVVFYPAAAVGSAYTVEVRQGTATGSVVGSFSGTTTVTNSGAAPTTPQSAAINISLPTPGTYVIGFATNPNTWRSDHGTSNPFPANIPGVLSVTNSLLGTTLSAQYWYYIYGWSITTGCESPRTQVVARVKSAADPSCATVPVTLTNFKGKTTVDGHLLSWTTLTESNNAGFVLQRSADGRQFTSLAEVGSAAPGGNSHQTLNYEQLDRLPLTGDNYYRLIQRDLGTGRQWISHVIKLVRTSTSELQITKLYPNPVSSVLNVQLMASKAEHITLQITDLAGKVVAAQKLNVPSGQQTVTLNTAALGTGVYLLKVLCSSGCEQSVQRFVKL